MTNKNEETKHYACVVRYNNQTKKHDICYYVETKEGEFVKRTLIGGQLKDLNNPDYLKQEILTPEQVAVDLMHPQNKYNILQMRKISVDGSNKYVVSPPIAVGLDSFIESLDKIIKNKKVKNNLKEYIEDLRKRKSNGYPAPEMSTSSPTRSKP